MLARVFFSTALAYLVMWETIKNDRGRERNGSRSCNVAAKRMHAVRSKDLQPLPQLCTFIFRLPFYTTSVRAMPTLQEHNGSSWRAPWSRLRWPNKVKGDEAWNVSLKTISNVRDTQRCHFLFFFFSISLWILDTELCKREIENSRWGKINLKLFGKLAVNGSAFLPEYFVQSIFGRIELSALKFKNRQERLARHDKYAALPLRHLQPRRGRPICAWISWTSASRAREGSRSEEKEGEEGKKRGKRPGVNGNWENRQVPGRGSKFHESLKFSRTGKRHCDFARVAGESLNRLAGTKTGGGGGSKSMSPVPGMALYKFAECNITRVTSAEKYLLKVHSEKLHIIRGDIRAS